jgi:hypothetical protein
MADRTSSQKWPIIVGMLSCIAAVLVWTVVFLMLKHRSRETRAAPPQAAATEAPTTRPEVKLTTAQIYGRAAYCLAQQEVARGGLEAGEDAFSAAVGTMQLSWDLPEDYATAALRNAKKDYESGLFNSDQCDEYQEAAERLHISAKAPF